MHVSLELLYTIYPWVLAVITAPLYIFFFIIERLFQTQNGIYAYVASALAWSVFPAAGVVFIAQLLSGTAQRQLKLPSVSSKRWWLIWGMIVLVANLIGLFTWFFPESELTIALIETPYIIGVWLSLAVIGFGASCFYGVKLVLNFIFTHIKTLQEKPRLTHQLLTISMILAIFPFLLLAVILIELFASPYKNPQASRFAVVHAAIKNTCLLDPRRDHCPQTLEEISYIEPQAYQGMLRGTQVNYVYYPDTNQYSLVIRYSPVNAVVFDQRLTRESSIDFKEYQVDLLGQDRLHNPPAWAGPWELEEWQYTQNSNL